MYKLYGAGFTACLQGLTISGIFIYLIRSYNGKRGKVHGNKYLYYAFYPVHLLVIGLFRIFFIGLYRISSASIFFPDRDRH